jgi:hypothetical protein
MLSHCFLGLAIRSVTVDSCPFLPFTRLTDHTAGFFVCASLVIVLVKGRERAGQPLPMATMHFAVVSPQ